VTDSLEVSLTEGQIKALFPDSYVGTKELAPGVFHPDEQIGIVTRNSDGVFSQSAKWGFIPGHQSERSFQPPHSHVYAKDVARRWTFSSAFKSWRCLIVASSYVVAPDVLGSTTYYRVRYADGSPMAIAGVYNPNSHGWASSGPSVAMLMAPGHSLLPAMGQWIPQVLLPHEWDQWLRYANTVPVAVKDMLKLRSSERLEFSTFEGEPPQEPGRSRRGQTASIQIAAVRSQKADCLQ
jgi:putative SOS response-associated peptidase YedK